MTKTNNGQLQLITINNDENGKQTVSARELYSKLGLNPANYSRWAKMNVTENPFAVENVDFSALFTMKSERILGNFAKDFALTIPFAKKLAMQAKTEQGERVRDYFLHVEKLAQNNQMQEYLVKEWNVPQNLGDALQLAANFAKANEQLKEENLQLAEANEQLETANNELEQANEELQEQVEKAQEFNESVFACPELLTYTDTAKILAVSPRKFIEFLRRRGMIASQYKNKNLPVADAVKKGYCKIQLCKYYDQEGGEHIKKLPYVTMRGLDFFRKFVAKYREEIEKISLKNLQKTA